MISSLKRDKGLQQVLLYGGLVLLFLLENNFKVGGHVIHSSMDDEIPFVPFFVLPYFSWFPLIGYTGILLYLKARRDLEKTFFSINLCMAIAMLVYLLYPNYLTLRPASYGNDVFSQWVRLLQQGDSPACVCPSLHVAVAMSLYFGITRCELYRKRTVIQIFMFLLTLSICASTVLIKQHSIVDVICGAVMSTIIYLFVYKFYYNEDYFPHRGTEDRFSV